MSQSGDWLGDQFFDAWHDDGDDALRILSECEYVPSFEVFQYGLEQARTRAHPTPLPVQRYAQVLFEDYQQAN